MSTMTYDDNIFRELKAVILKADPEGRCIFQETIRVVPFQPYLPRVSLALGWKSFMWAPPEGPQSCFDNGRDALHQVGILRPPCSRILFFKGLDLSPQFANTCWRCENRSPSRCVRVFGVCGNPQKMEATGIHALCHEWFARPALDLEINTRPVPSYWITNCIDSLQQSLRMLAAIWYITRSICLTAASRLKRHCPTETVCEQMRAISIHSVASQVLVAHADVPWMRSASLSRFCRQKTKLPFGQHLLRQLQHLPLRARLQPWIQRSNQQSRH